MKNLFPKAFVAVLALASVQTQSQSYFERAKEFGSNVSAKVMPSAIRDWIAEDPERAEALALGLSLAAAGTVGANYTGKKAYGAAKAAIKKVGVKATLAGENFSEGLKGAKGAFNVYGGI